MNKNKILTIFLLFTITSKINSEQRVIKTICAAPVPIEGAPPVRCYKGLDPFSRSSLNIECRNVSAIPININSVEWATEIINIMKLFKFYGIWIDASQVDGSQYQWSDGRLAPSPLKWCQGSTKNLPYLVLVCNPYGTYSYSNCCVSDREDTTSFASLCLRIMPT